MAALAISDTTIYPHIDKNCLGVLINTQFDFLSHVKSMEQKISRSMGIILKLCSFLPSSALLN